MEPVLLVGAFGQGNPGDDALLRAFRSALDGWPLVVVSHDPANREGERSVPAGAASGVARAVVECATVVLAGGTVFKTLHPSARRRRLDLLLRAVTLAGGARALGRRVAMVGVGAGRLDGPAARLLARGLARQATLLVLRDERSAAALTAAGAPGPHRVGSDPAWTIFDSFVPEAGAPPDGDWGDVALILNHEADVSEDTMVAALAPLAAEGRRLAIVPWQTGPFGRDEQESAERLAVRLGPLATATAPPRDVAAAAKSMRGCQAVLTQRFHALHAAAAAGVPTVAIDHEAKMGALAGRLEQGAVARTAPARVVHAQVVAALTAAPASPDAVRIEQARAEDGFRLLRLMLDPSRLDDLAGLDGLPLAAATAASPHAGDQA